MNRIKRTQQPDPHQDHLTRPIHDATKPPQEARQQQPKPEDEGNPRTNKFSSNGFRTSQHANAPCRLKGPAQVRCLQKKYDHCISKKKTFCSLYDLQKAVEKVKMGYEIPVGTQVMARWKSPNGEHNAGKITSINSDGTYDVRFDNELLQVNRRKNTPREDIKRDDVSQEEDM